MHRANNVCAGGSAGRTLLVIGQNDHIVITKSVSVFQKRCQIPDIVNTTLELIRSAKVIDTDQQSLLQSGFILRRRKVPSVYQCIVNIDIDIATRNFGYRKAVLVGVVGEARQRNWVHFEIGCVVLGGELWGMAEGTDNSLARPGLAKARGSASAHTGVEEREIDMNADSGCCRVDLGMSLLN